MRYIPPAVPAPPTSLREANLGSTRSKSDKGANSGALRPNLTSGKAAKFVRIECKSQFLHMPREMSQILI